MPGSILVARIFGIDVRIHLSWFLIFGLILFAYSSPDGAFSQVRPTWSEQKLVLVAAIYAVMFFGSVLAHELSHSLVARRFRMPVSSITLFLLGGVANLSKEPPSAGAEFLMAAAGPLTSLLIGIVGLGVAQVADQLVGRSPTFDVVSVLALYLGTTNLLLAGFNMIPGFPLDGGRVLRSIIWGIARDRSRATRIAARGGQLVAGLLFLFGIWRAIVLEDAVSAVWMGMIAYFLYNAASSSLEQERVAVAVRGVKVASLMSQEFRAVHPGTPLSELVYTHVLPHNARAIAVVDGRHLNGLVTIADLQKVEQSAWPATRVDEVMTPASALPVVSPGSYLMTAIERFASSATPVLPVVDDGALVGMLEREAVWSYVRMREMLDLR